MFCEINLKYDKRKHVIEEGPLIYSRSECPTATKELRELHFSYLNQDYNEDVLDSWRDDGCFFDIALHLGYRLVLRKVYSF